MNTKRSYQFGARSATAAHPTNQRLLDVVSVWLVWLQRVSNFSLDL